MICIIFQKKYILVFCVWFQFFIAILFYISLNIKHFLSWNKFCIIKFFDKDKDILNTFLKFLFFHELHLFVKFIIYIYAYNRIFGSERQRKWKRNWISFTTLSSLSVSLFSFLLLPLLFPQLFFANSLHSYCDYITKEPPWFFWFQFHEIYTPLTIC